MDGDKYARRFQRTDSSMWRGILLNQKLCGLARSGIGRPRPTSAAGAGTQHVAFFSNSQFCTQNSREFRLGHTAIFSFAHFARGFLIFNVFSRQPILTASSASGSRFPLGQNPEICPSGKDSCADHRPSGIAGRVWRCLVVPIRSWQLPRPPQFSNLNDND